MRWCDAETFWLWHTVNAFETKDPADAAAHVVVLASGPVATIRMPVRVPLGLHGNWLPNT